jgi:L-rhamnose mutarotase
MFFGLTNSPATFQSMMDDIFAKEVAQGWLKIYMDDMVIATKDDEEFHAQCVERILRKLLENDLFLKPEKCQFHQ